MALLFIDSFDHYDAAHVLAKWTSHFIAPEMRTAQGRCGTNCMEIRSNVDLTKGLYFQSSTGTIGFAVQIESSHSLSAGSIDLCRVYGTDGLHLSLWYHGVDGTLSIVRNGSPDETLGTTIPDVIRRDRWYFIEWQMTIASSGAVVVRVNTLEALVLSGVQTNGSLGEYNFFQDLTAVMFSCPSNQQWLLDDVYILDSTGAVPWSDFLGDCRVEYLRPRAAGSLQAWDVVGAPSHWEAVDDGAAPDDDLTYITTTTVGETDVQLYQPTGVSAGPIYGVQVSLLARKTEGGPRLLAPVIVQSGTPAVGLSQAPGLDYRYLMQLFPFNPVTFAPWTIADVNADEVGVQVTV